VSTSRRQAQATSGRGGRGAGHAREQDPVEQREALLRGGGLVQALGQAAGVGAQEILEPDHPSAELTGRDAEQRTGAQGREVDLDGPGDAVVAHPDGRVGEPAGERAVVLGLDRPAVGEVDDEHDVGACELQARQRRCAAFPEVLVLPHEARQPRVGRAADELEAVVGAVVGEDRGRHVLACSHSGGGARAAQERPVLRHRAERPPDVRAQAGLLVGEQGVGLPAARGADPDGAGGALAQDAPQGAADGGRAASATGADGGGGQALRAQPAEGRRPDAEDPLRRLRDGRGVEDVEDHVVAQVRLGQRGERPAAQRGTQRR
jgi:hypothetical protein